MKNLLLQREPEMPGSLCIQQPADAARLLVLLFHGVGASAREMAPVGQHLARVLPSAFIASVDGPRPADSGAGRQWFSVRGITEESRPSRIAAVMPEFQATVRQWQVVAGVAPAATVLLGFSQGAIMALEATQEPEQVAGRVVALSGRFAVPPRSAPPGVVLHLIHGEQDPVIACGHSIYSATRLRQLGADVSLDVVPSLGHGIDGRTMSRVLARITSQEPVAP